MPLIVLLDQFKYGVFPSDTPDGDKVYAVEYVTEDGLVVRIVMDSKGYDEHLAVLEARGEDTPSPEPERATPDIVIPGPGALDNLPEHPGAA